MKKALITGVTGQDGSYLAELLLSKGYEVHGLVRRSSSSSLERLIHVKEKLTLHSGDMTDGARLRDLIERNQFDEVYNLAAQSHVGDSFHEPVYTLNATGGGALRLLDAIRLSSPQTRFYQASSSEMFGSSPSPQSEMTIFHPRSPYACAKVYAHHQTVNYREAYNLHASCGILFNHESPRRGETFVTRKITKGLASIKAGREKTLLLGDIGARRDWGFAGDYVEAMWLMLQQETPNDYVIATGESHTVRDFLEIASEVAGLRWRDCTVWNHPDHIRPSEVPHLKGDATKANVNLDWRLRTSFEGLVEMMMRHDLKAEGL